MALVDNLFSLVPISVLHRALEIGAMVAIQVGKNAVLVLQTAIMSYRRV